MSLPILDLTQNSTLLIEQLNSLPLELNRYDVVFASLSYSIGYKLSGPVQRLLYAYVGLFCIIFLLAAIGLVARALSGNFRLITVNGGLITPQASLFFAIFQLVFAATETAVIIAQSMAAHGDYPIQPLTVFGVGFVWLFAAWSIIPWFWAVTASVIRRRAAPPAIAAASLPIEESPPDHFRQYRRQAFALNALVLLLPCIGTPAITVSFALAKHQWASALMIANSVLASLVQASPSYNPATFDILTDLVPLMQPLPAMQSHVLGLKKWYTVGFAEWAGYKGIFIIFLLPFFLIHCVEVAKLSRSLPMSWMTRTRSTTRVSKAISAAETERSAQERTKFRLALLSSATVLLTAMVIFGVTIAAAIKSNFILNRDGGHTGSILVAVAVGAYAFAAPVPLLIFAHASVKEYLAHRRGVQPEPERKQRQGSLVIQLQRSEVKTFESVGSEKTITIAVPDTAHATEGVPSSPVTSEAGSSSEGEAGQPRPTLTVNWLDEPTRRE